MADIFDVIGKGLDVGLQIYGAQLQKKAMRQQAKYETAAGYTNDFPMLGMGLAATGPQRTIMNMGQPVSQGGMAVAMPGVQSGGSSTAVSVRGLTQYVVYTTPSGSQRVTGVRGLGTPLLWSGDLAAVRRVARIARKLGRFTHRRPR